MCSTLGGVTRGEPRRERYCTQMGGGTPPHPRGGSTTTWGGYPPHTRTKPLLLRGGTRGHMFSGRTDIHVHVMFCKYSDHLIGTAGGYPPPPTEQPYYYGGLPRPLCISTGGGYPPPTEYYGGLPPPHKKAPLLLPRGGVPPPLRSNSVSVVKEKRPSRTCESANKRRTTKKNQGRTKKTMQIAHIVM